MKQFLFFTVISFFLFSFSFVQKHNNKGLSLAIDEMCVCLETGDKKCLEKMIANKSTFSETLFTSMLAVHKKSDYKKIFTKQQPAKEANKFTLGGHSDEYEHIHIEFKNKLNGWTLEKIWRCR